MQLTTPTRNGVPLHDPSELDHCRNEYLSFQVLFAPPGRPRTVTAKLSDLRGDESALIPASACQVRLLEYVPFGDKWLPDPLMEEQPFRPSGRGPIVFWVTIHVPEGAEPGDYRGILTMRADGGAPATCDLGVRDSL